MIVTGPIDKIKSLQYPTNESYEQFLARKQEQYGYKGKCAFDTSDLAQKFIRYFNTQERIEVKFKYGGVKRGRVGVTTGWKPVFLLMLRRDSIGSVWTLSEDDEIVKVVSK